MVAVGAILQQLLGFDLTPTLVALEDSDSALTIAFEELGEEGEWVGWFAVEADVEGEDPANLAQTLAGIRETVEGEARRFEWGQGLAADGFSGGEYLTSVAGPFSVAGHRVVAFGREEDMERVAKERLRGPEGQLREFAWQQSRGKADDSALLRLDLDLLQVVELGRRELARRVGGIGIGAMFDALGISSLERFGFALRTRGPRVSLESEVVFQPGKPRGTVGGFLHHEPTAPVLQLLVMPDAAGWFVTKLRADKVLGGVLDAVEAVFPARAYLFDEFGVHLEEDVFETLDDEVLILGDATKAGSSLGLAMVFKVRDAATLDPALDQFADSVDARVDGEVAGVKVWESWDDLRWSRPGGYWVVGWGGSGRNVVDSATRRCAAGEPLAPHPGLKAVGKAQRVAPPGFSGCGYSDFERVATLGVDLLGIVQLPHALRSRLNGFFAEVQREFDERGVEPARVLVGSEEQVWRVRVVL